ncbi:hypothetical protein [Streptomyces sp. 2A115]|uniref:hypothetical protein n=1 Tax=Streptomyces sp. 2A115 TaxID=3457439 RepID=UPI003FD25D13
MAFGAEELRVLRRALALALHPSPASAEDVQDCLRLAESVDEAAHEGARLRAFLLADLARYRAALPGTAAGYLTLLEEALGAGYRPNPDDLAGLRALRGNPIAAALLARCHALVEQDVRTRLAVRTVPASRTSTSASASDSTSASAEARPHDHTRVRTRLTALPGGLAPDTSSRARVATCGTTEAAKDPGKKPAEKPAEKPAPQPQPHPSHPDRPIPTPGEVFPPRRKPSAPPAGPPQQLAVG